MTPSGVSSPLPPESYGELTAAFERILAPCRSGRWFFGPSSPSESSGQELLEALRRAAPAGAAALPPVEVVRSGAEGLRPLLARARFDPERPADSWRQEATRRLSARLAEVRDEPWFQARIGPPLWPIPGQPTICRPLVADRSLPGSVTTDTGSQEALWLLLCQAEFDVWHALQWLAAGLSPEDNPFEPWVRLQAAGYFPLGVLDGRLILWTLAPPK